MRNCRQTLALSAVLACSTVAASSATLTLICRTENPLAPANQVAPDWGMPFTLTVPFGEGFGLGLVEPDTQRINRMLFASDVLVGNFSSPGAMEAIAWTRASSIRAPLLGQTIRGDGHVIVVNIGRAGAPDAPREARVYDSVSGALWSGQCVGGN